MMSEHKSLEERLDIVRARTPSLQLRSQMTCEQELARRESFLSLTTPPRGNLSAEAKSDREALQVAEISRLDSETARYRSEISRLETLESELNAEITASADKLETVSREIAALERAPELVESRARRLEILSARSQEQKLRSYASSIGIAC